MSLEVTILNKRQKYYELQACYIAKEYEDTNVSLYEFPERFKADLGRVPKKSTGTADQFYRAYLSEDYNKIEIWHLNSIGDKDRKIAEVIDNGVVKNHFNF